MGFVHPSAYTICVGIADISKLIANAVRVRFMFFLCNLCTKVDKNPYLRQFFKQKKVAKRENEVSLQDNHLVQINWSL